MALMTRVSDESKKEIPIDVCAAALKARLFVHTYACIRMHACMYACVHMRMHLCVVFDRGKETRQRGCWSRDIREVIH